MTEEIKIDFRSFTAESTRLRDRRNVIQCIQRKEQRLYSLRDTKDIIHEHNVLMWHDDLSQYLYQQKGNIVEAIPKDMVGLSLMPLILGQNFSFATHHLPWILKSGGLNTMDMCKAFAERFTRENMLPREVIKN